ncbi:M23 family metallopeptidase [Crassaminicella indica]|uniref:M23 family metallopeptidase n=1 Tax=Crassaminicella indica TaxID=2855394 RepID=A0ABX8RE78_9CLOT|nr:M23 family metallopeptidase [Crassaminicella indica]QXM06699.1 M23 family metallopeptidase [Crassaminicella indica]
MGFKKWSKNRGLYKLLDNEGFYIVLFLCVCIVATTAMWVTKKNINQFIAEDIKTPSVEENQSLDINAYDHSPSIVVEDMEDKEELTVSSAVLKKDDKIIKSKPKKAKKEIVSNKKVQMIEPLKGKRGMGYAANKLIYSKTLDQYTTHHGIDIIASENTPVVAALSGEVVEVTRDAQLGITIAISHGDHMITKYANLSTEKMVKVGDWVEQGQIISGVGKTALFETLEEPHLHFEVLIDGKNVDPNTYLSSKN